MRRLAYEPRISGPRRKSRAFLFYLLAAGVLLGACEDPYVLGVRAHEFRQRMSAGDRSVLLSAPLERLDELARLGPGALYYASRAAGLSGDEERELVLLRLAADREAGLFRRRAWELLPDLLYNRRDWAGLLSFSEVLSKAGVDAYLPRRRRAEALAGLDRFEEARAELESLFASYPEEAARDSGLLAALRLKCASSPQERADLTRALFALPDAQAQDLADALSAAQAQDTQDKDPRTRFSPGELRLFRLRAEIARRDYGAAYRALESGSLDLLTPETPRAFLADAGKAYLYAPALKEGLEAMDALAAEAEKSDSPRAVQARYLALFYRSRMLRQRELYPDAAKGFEAAYALARTGEDKDAAAWYWVESLISVQRRAAADALARTAPDWANPAAFADVVERMAREALLARDGQTLFILRTEVSPRMTVRAGARLVYLAGRAVQSGLALPGKAAEDNFDPADYARRAFEEVLARSPEPYYRLLASYRLDKPLVEVPDSRPIGRPETEPAPEETMGRETEAYLQGFVEYGLAELAAPEARALEGSPEAPDIEVLRRLALRLHDTGEYAQSMIVMNRILENQGYESSREDLELFWPRPWRMEVSESATASGMDEYVLYGLIRSESFFRPSVVSRAGAVGLAQLMPPTAQEVARRLRMDSYDLADPKDNIRLGSAHFAGLMRPLNGRLLSSVFAYNAGLSRVRAWEKAAPDFPDDLLLESLSIEETRQYGRNVLWASVVYGMIYYGLDPRQTLVRLLGE